MMVLKQSLLLTILMLGLCVSSLISASPAKSLEGQTVADKTLREHLGKPVYRATVLHVIDGDTFTARIFLAEDVITQMRVRIKSVDAPELHHARCPYEREQAQKAYDVLETMLVEANGKVLLFDTEPGKYSGRVLANVRYDRVDVGRQLLQQGVAEPYQGGKRINWCSRAPKKSQSPGKSP